MSRILYNTILVALAPVILPVLHWRRAKGKEPNWEERWGQLLPFGETDEKCFWVHAVSVGEVMAAVPVLRELRKRHPDARIVLSSTTTGGYEVAKARPEVDRVIAFPVDSPQAVRKALQSVKPNLMILMEWEVWPNFLYEAKAQGVKVAIVNGRVSDKGLARGEKFGWLLKEALKHVDLFAMQSTEDARRAALLGAPSQRIEVFGNTKFDETALPLTPKERVALRGELGIPEGAPVLVCGSTRDGKDGVPDEEILVAEAVKIIRQTLPELKVIVAPRHRDRADIAAAHLGRVARRSLGEIGSTMLLDTFGELGKIYAAADVAFVGGSLAPWGGQSVFQPLAQGVPALFVAAL